MHEGARTHGSFDRVVSDTGVGEERLDSGREVGEWTGARPYYSSLQHEPWRPASKCALGLSKDLLHRDRVDRPELRGVAPGLQLGKMTEEEEEEEQEARIQLLTAAQPQRWHGIKASPPVLLPVPCT